MQWADNQPVITMEKTSWKCWGGRRSPDMAFERNSQWSAQHPPAMMVRMNISEKGLMYLVSHRLLEIINESTTSPWDRPEQKFRFFGQMARVFRHPSTGQVLFTLTHVDLPQRQ